MKRPSTGQNVALGVTLIVALLLLIFLTATRLHLSGKQTESARENITMAEIEPEDLQEMLIEPILQDAGEPAESEDLSSAPIPQGEPEQAPVNNDKLVVNGKNPVPNPSAEKVVSAKSPSPAKTAAPSEKDQPDSRISSTMKGQFSSTNGKPGGNGATASSGNGGNASGVSGTMGNGRKLEYWVLPTVTLTQKTVVTVKVMVNADGKVTSATAQPGPASAALKEICRKASLNTRWTPKKGAPPASGTIIWTLVPKL